jgi:hypothetical protein
MSTCPECGAFLGDRHRCVPAWRRRARVALLLGRSATIGALVGAVVLLAIDGRASWYAVALSGGVGVMIDLAVHVR